MSKKFTKLIILFLTVFTVSYTQAQTPDVGLIVNEISNGPSGEKEYIELLVVGCPGAGSLSTVDTNRLNISKWIVDDNNGDFSGGAGTGLSIGHIRFRDVAVWQAVPIGSIILIYNDLDIHPSINFGNDPTDANGDRLYVLPVSHPSLEMCTSFPDIGTATYIGCTDASYVSPATWSVIGLRNDGDAIQTRKPDGTFFHGVSYGDISGNPNGTLSTGTNSIHFGGTSGTGRSFYFANSVVGSSDNYRINGNYASSTTIATPGVNNTLINGNLINRFRTPTNAGKDTLVCSNSYSFLARGFATEWSLERMWTFSSFGTWEKISGPGTVSFASNNSDRGFLSNDNVVVDASGTYTFRWTQDQNTPLLPDPSPDFSCSDADEVTVTFVNNPIAEAGPAQIVCGFTTNLDADAFPFASWSLESKPTGAADPVFANVKNENTQVQVTQAGDYFFRWTVGLVGVPGCTANDVVKVSFVDVSVNAFAGNDKQLCDTLFTLEGSGIPGNWSVVSAPAGGVATFSDGSNPRSEVKVNNPGGEFTFRWTIGADPCEKLDEVKITFFPIPKPNIGKDTTLCGNQFLLQGVGEAEPTIVGQWTATPNTGVTFSPSAGDPNATVTVPNTGGVYNFRWTLTNTTTTPNCNGFDEINVKFVPQPNILARLSTADSLAGPDVGFCGLGGSTNAKLPTDTDPATTISGLWVYVGSNPVGLPTPTILAPTNPNTGITATQGGTYTFRWTVTVQVTGQGGTTILCPQSGEIDVLLIDVPGGPNIAAINAGTDQAQVCGVTPNHITTLAGSAVPTNYTGTWALSTLVADKPAGATAIFSPPNSPNTSVSVNLPGTYKFVWINSTTVTATDGKQYTCGVSDTVAVTFVAIPDANPGKDTLVCALNYLLSANLPIGAIGNTPTPTTGVWTVAPGAPGTVTFTPNATTPNATATVTVEGTYNLIWTLTLGTCTDDDTLKVDFVIPPTPNAGLNQVRCQFTTTLAANSTATQLAGTVGVWSIVSQPTGGGATTASFSNINNPLATFTVASKIAGNYNLRWTFTRTYNGQQVCPVFDDVTIQFDPTPPANAGANQIGVCATPGTTLLGATATANSTGAWSLLSTVPNGLTVNFVDATSPTTNATFSAAGTYNLIWRVQGNQDATCFNTDTVSITVTPPLFTTVTDVAPLCGLTTSLVATTTPTNLQIGQWTASPATGVVFTNPTAPNTSVTVPGTGVYTFTWTTGNGVCTAIDNTVIDFSTPIVGASATPLDQALYFGKTTTATASVTSPSSVTYTWSVVSGTVNSVSPTNIATPTFNPTEDSEYEVTIRSGSSCVETSRIRIRVIREIYVPNVFTPNGDGLYDTWVIRELDGFTNASVKVFNRWGDLIFENKGAYTKPWDGTYNGKPVGTATYYYVIDKGEAVPAPDKREIKGSVTVTY